MGNHRLNVTLLLTLLLLFGLVSGCGPTTGPTDTPEPCISDERLAAIQDDCAEMIPDPDMLAEEYPGFQDLIYVAGQVILTGSQEHITTIAVLLDFLDDLGDGFSLNDETEVRRYQIGGNLPVEQVVCMINAVADECNYSVFADPNYHMSPAGWAGGASPWTQNGQWTEGIGGGGIVEAMPEAFEGQWALGPKGIGLFDDNGRRVSTDNGDVRGEGIRVGVFDTSPFSDTEAREGQPPMPIPLTVKHPPLFDSPDCPGTDFRSGQDREGQDISNHGLFVAGLVHVVAPSSDIHLIRVLEDDGCGDLFLIAKNIAAFMEEAVADMDNGAVEGIVINLSLGIHQPPTPFEVFKLPKDVKLLEAVLGQAMTQGAVIVAAAGNDSYEVVPDDELLEGELLPLPSSMELPAAYPFVIGVAASNIDGKRGCFSNSVAGDLTRDVAAPGGDGEKEDGELCKVPACSDDNREPCLVSLIHKPEPGYAYWVGTSFATPLVSGQVALLLEQGRLQTDPADWPSQMVCPLQSDTILPNGIISLPQSLIEPAPPCP